MLGQQVSELLFRGGLSHPEIDCDGFASIWAAVNDLSGGGCGLTCNLVDPIGRCLSVSVAVDSAMPRLPLVPLFGAYRPPKCRRGDKLFCEVRDAWVTVGGLFGRGRAVAVRQGTGQTLADPDGGFGSALRQEAGVVVSYVFAIAPAGTVSKLRAALEVPRRRPARSGGRSPPRSASPARRTSGRR